MRGRLAPELEGTEDEKVSRSLACLARQMHQGAQPHQGGLVLRRPGMNVRPARYRRGELTAHMFDLRQQIEAGDVFRLLLEHSRDLNLGVEQVADLDQEFG